MPLGSMPAQQCTEEEELIWCSLNTETLKFPELQVKFTWSEFRVKTQFPKRIFHTVVNYNQKNSTLIVNVTPKWSLLLKIQKIIQAAESTHSIHKCCGFVSGFGKMEREQKEANLFFIQKDQSRACSSSYIKDQNINS